MDARRKKGVFLLDYDGCLVHAGVSPFLSTNPVVSHSDAFYLKFIAFVIKANPFLLAFLIKICKEQTYTDLVIGFGTNRQSKETDVVNGRGSCFRVIHAFFEHLAAEIKKEIPNINIHFDKFLLADLYGGLEDGTSYKKAMADLPYNKPSDHSRWKFDETKFSISFVHAQRNAKSGVPTDVYLIDDRLQFRDTFNKSYTVYPVLLPKKTTLSFIHYYGGEPKLYPGIQGKGEIFQNHQEIVRKMADIAAKSGGDGYITPLRIGESLLAEQHSLALLGLRSFIQRNDEIKKEGLIIQFIQARRSEVPDKQRWLRYADHTLKDREHGFVVGENFIHDLHWSALINNKGHLDFAYREGNDTPWVSKLPGEAFNSTDFFDKVCDAQVEILRTDLYCSQFPFTYFNSHLSKQAPASQAQVQAKAPDPVSEEPGFCFTQ